MADEEYYVKNGFSPPEGAATCNFLGFSYFFQLLSLLPLLMGHMMTLSQLYKLIRCKPSENEIVHKCAQKWYFWGPYDQK